MNTERQTQAKWHMHSVHNARTKTQYQVTKYTHIRFEDIVLRRTIPRRRCFIQSELSQITEMAINNNL